MNFHHENNSRFNTLEINNYLKKYNLFSFEYRIFYRLSLFIHKINLNKFPLGLFNQLKLNSEVKNVYNLRNNSNYCVPCEKITSKSKFNDSTFSIFFCKFLNLLFSNYPFLLFKNYLISN